MSEIPEPSELAKMRWWPILLRAYGISDSASPKGGLDQLSAAIVAGSGQSTGIKETSEVGTAVAVFLLELGENGKLDPLVADPAASLSTWRPESERWSDNPDL